MSKYDYHDYNAKMFFKASERWAEAQTNKQLPPKYPEPSTPVLTMQTELARTLANPQGTK